MHADETSNVDIGGKPETVLDLYDRAYDFHYEKKQPARAARIYREIIRRFPSSNECAYAAIQLEKITAGKVLRKAQKQMKAKVPAWVIVLLVLNLVATVLVGAAFLMYISSDIHSIMPALGNRTSAGSRVHRCEYRAVSFDGKNCVGWSAEEPETVTGATAGRSSVAVGSFAPQTNSSTLVKAI